MTFVHVLFYTRKQMYSLKPFKFAIFSMQLVDRDSFLEEKIVTYICILKHVYKRLTHFPEMSIKENKKRRNGTKTRFSTIQPSIYVTGKRNERWQ